MDSKLKPYEEYKKIDLPWLLKIPDHWEMTRNKNVMKIKKELVGKNHNQYVLLSLTKQGIIARDMVNLKGKFPKEFDTYQSVNPGDIVFCLFDIDETPRTIGLSSLSGMITGAYTVFEIENINRKYLYYFYLSLDNHKQLKPLYTGLRKVINTDHFLRTKMPYPPEEEQDQIVRYLDDKLSKINKFIKAKKKQVELLKEQKQAIINKAVTKGLDSNVKMKPSGIEWIGGIPEEWEVNKLGYIGRCQNGISESGDFFESGHPFVSYGDVYNNIQLPSRVDGVAKSNKQQQHVYSVKCGDIFFTRTSETIEEIGLSSVCLETIEEAVFSGFLIRFRPYDNKLDKEFSKYYFRNNKIREYFIREMNIVTRASLSQTLLKNMPVVLPSLMEQEKISRYLEIETHKIDRIIAKFKREIDLITEYRTCLISDIVTGKIDVRNFEVEDADEIIEENFEDVDEEMINEEGFDIGEEE